MTDNDKRARSRGREREPIPEREPLAIRRAKTEAPDSGGTGINQPKVPSLDQVACLVALAAARDEVIRRWFVLTLACALHPGTAVVASRAWLLPNGLLVPPDLALGVRYRRADRPGRRVVRLPSSALAELGSWASDPWIGTNVAGLRRRLDRLQGARSSQDRLLPSALRVFAAYEIRRVSPALDTPRILAWLGLRYEHLLPSKLRLDSIDVTPVAEAAELVLRQVHERSGGVLLRAVSVAGEGKAG